MFEGWHGTGFMFSPNACDWWDLRGGGLDNFISSVKTHGNGLWLYDEAAGEYVGYVPQWTQTNLASWENDRADWFYVDCR